MIKVPGHRLLIKVDKLEDSDPVYKKMAELGLARPDHTDVKREQQAVATGTVIQVGPTAFVDYGGDPWCKEGDRIYFAKYAGMTVRDGEDSYQVILDEDVVCIIED